MYIYIYTMCICICIYFLWCIYPNSWLALEISNYPYPRTPCSILFDSQISQACCQGLGPGRAQDGAVECVAFQLVMGVPLRQETSMGCLMAMELDNRWWLLLVVPEFRRLDHPIDSPITKERTSLATRKIIVVANDEVPNMMPVNPCFKCIPTSEWKASAALSGWG